MMIKEGKLAHDMQKGKKEAKKEIENTKKDNDQK